MAGVVPQDHGARHVGDPEAKAGVMTKSSLEDPSGSGDVTSADQLLESLGYAPEMTRNRSTMQVAFMSFVMAAIPYGLMTTMYYPLAGGGTANVIWGWLAVSCIILCVAASLGEITSVYPTAGGVYYQTFMLSPPRWRRVAGWVCGWLYVVGNVTITLAVNFGTALFLVASIGVFETAEGESIFAAETYQVFLIFLAITLLCNAVSALGDKWLPWLDTAAIYWTFAGLISLVVCILAIAKNGRHSAEYVFTSFEPRSGWVPGWSFCVGLLQAAYATSSTGMIISMCEEVRAPATQVPKAMVATVVLNTFAGLLTLIPLMFVLPNIDDLLALASGQPVPAIIKSAIGSSGGSFALLIPMLVLALICGIGCTTATSRCIWAFARDGAIPGSQLWKTIDKKLGVPLNAMMLSMAVQIILGLIYFGSTAAFNAFSGVGVICLTTSYAMPIAVNLLNKREAVKGASFNLGVMGPICNYIALAWSLLAVPLFCMPTTIPVMAATMNYASVVFVAFTLISTIWYFVWGHANYAGPPT
ncbi:amino acid permease [Diaporthe helianthi]|uniref:Amino acid permease n=1 Tax=Diaporthe helianthi TaxID=158607 RepID=A0A2P5HJY9_DIAHE|nr:amino acid permease [Diaporthe helianthi]